MTSTLLPPSDDDLQKAVRSLEPRKQKTIKPLGKAATKTDTSVPGANDDLLEELRRKTAELAAKIDNQKRANKTSTEIETDLTVDPPNDDKEQNLPQSNDSLEATHVSSIVRGKLERIFGDEPDAKLEIATLEHHPQRLSKHQEYMQMLTSSGASIADIQTKWHTYYVNLPEEEKHQVWREFYENRPSVSDRARHTQKHSKPNSAKTHRPNSKPKVYQPAHQLFTPTEGDQRNSGDIKRQILNKISADGALTAKHHLKSLLFGVSISALALIISSFVFFNEAFVAPFISPGRTVSATPIIGTLTSEVDLEPKIIIPKINLEVPVVFDLQSTEEEIIQEALEEGVVHYASTPKPGEVGNTVIVGHSSNNIFNQGKYKFAFVLLNRLEGEDTFFVHREGVRYTYKVYRKEVVSPNAVSVLDTQDRPNTITLITCDPPGTSINRLIIVAEQISPDPSENIASTAKIDPITEESLPSNAPSLWSRLWPF